MTECKSTKDFLDNKSHVFEELCKAYGVEFNRTGETTYTLKDKYKKDDEMEKQAICFEMNRRLAKAYTDTPHDEIDKRYDDLIEKFSGKRPVRKESKYKQWHKNLLERRGEEIVDGKVVLKKEASAMMTNEYFEEAALEKQALLGPLAGAGIGAMMGNENQKGEAMGVGALRGMSAEGGAGAGALLGLGAGAGLGAGVGSLLGDTDTGLNLGAAIGGLGGAGLGGYGGYQFAKQFTPTTAFDSKEEEPEESQFADIPAMDNFYYEPEVMGMSYMADPFDGMTDDEVAYLLDNYME